mmetsp:Transcript_23706/g.3937  ORF Transcript_23706/g.3937 Transcript_23706/m.3937 type:complete len:81 (-) Transcript_23706:469-711(-)
MDNMGTVYIDSFIINYTTIRGVNPSISLNNILCVNHFGTDPLCLIEEDCSEGCTSDLLLNNYCEEECNTSECDFDLGNCR